MDLPRTPSFRLDSRKALVTGGSSGIGLGAAVALAEAGAHVVVSARGTDRVEAAVEAMVAEGWSAEPLALDVADIDAVADAVAAHGPFDILVNSAGLARHTPAAATNPTDYDAVMDLNTRGAYFLASAVANGLVAAGKPGSIITISSQMGHVGGVDRAVYCASKFAVEGMTKAMAIEFGPNQIRVNTIGPTFVRTPLTEPTFSQPDKVAWIEDMIKLGRVGEVEDIMGAVVFLASSASALVTGTCLLVDGGWTAH
ncbi:MAG: SDR family oxidoreductase [Pseudomonadota bacterium]